MASEGFGVVVVWTGILFGLTFFLLGIGGIWKMEIFLARRVAAWRKASPQHTLLRWALIIVPAPAMFFAAWQLYAFDLSWKQWIAYALVLFFTVPWNGALLSGFRLHARQ